MVLWRPTRPSRTNTQIRCSLHYRGLECKSRKSSNIWSNRQIWLGVQNEAGQKLTEFCQENALVIANILFQQHKRRLYTWTSPDGQYWNQLYFNRSNSNSILISSNEPSIESWLYLYASKYRSNAQYWHLSKGRFYDIRMMIPTSFSY